MNCPKYTTFLTLQYTSPITHLPLLSPLMPLSVNLVLLSILISLSPTTSPTSQSRSCFMHIHDLRRIRPMLGFKTASTIATSIVHSKLDYCNFLFLSLDSIPKYMCTYVSSSFKIYLRGPSPERPGIITSLLFLNHFTGYC